jgi:hypothetical protein
MFRTHAHTHTRTRTHTPTRTPTRAPTHPHPHAEEVFVQLYSEKSTGRGHITGLPEEEVRAPKEWRKRARSAAAVASKRMRSWCGRTLMRACSRPCVAGARQGRLPVHGAVSRRRLARRARATDSPRRARPGHHFNSRDRGLSVSPLCHLFATGALHGLLSCDLRAGRTELTERRPATCAERR